MPAAIFFGSLLLAFGPLLAVTLLFVSQRAHLLLVMLARAFCASLGLLLASGLWWMIPPLRDAPLAVIAQMVVGLEVAHLLFLWGYGRADRALKQLSMLRVPMDDVTSGIAAGAGQAALMALVVYGGLLGQSGGDASVLHSGCPNVSAYTFTAIVCLLFTLVHMGLEMTSLIAWTTRAWVWLAVAVATHGATAGLTALHNKRNGCAVSLPLISVLVLVSMGVAVHVARHRLREHEGARQAHAR